MATDAAAVSLPRVWLRRSSDRDVLERATTGRRPTEAELYELPNICAALVAHHAADTPFADHVWDALDLAAEPPLTNLKVDGRSLDEAVALLIASIVEGLAATAPHPAVYAVAQLCGLGGHPHDEAINLRALGILSSAGMSGEPPLKELADYAGGAVSLTAAIVASDSLQLPSEPLEGLHSAIRALADAAGGEVHLDALLCAAIDAVRTSAGVAEPALEPTGLEAEEVPDEPGAEPDTPMSPDAAAVEEEASAKAALEIEPSELPASQVGEDLEAAPIATLDDDDDGGATEMSVPKAAAEGADEIDEAVEQDEAAKEDNEEDETDAPQESTETERAEEDDVVEEEATSDEADTLADDNGVPSTDPPPADATEESTIPTEERLQWAALVERLPIGDGEDIEARGALFDSCSAASALTLSEVLTGLHSTLKPPEGFSLSSRFDAIVGAGFDAAADECGASDGESDRRVGRWGFMLLLAYVRRHIELRLMLNRLDVDSEPRVALVEFEEALKKGASWLTDRGALADPQSSFTSVAGVGAASAAFSDVAHWLLLHCLPSRAEGADAAAEAEESTMRSGLPVVPLTSVIESTERSRFGTTAGDDGADLATVKRGFFDASGMDVEEEESTATVAAAKPVESSPSPKRAPPAPPAKDSSNEVARLREQLKAMRAAKEEAEARAERMMAANVTLQRQLKDLHTRVDQVVKRDLQRVRSPPAKKKGASPVVAKGPFPSDATPPSATPESTVE